MPSKTFLDAYQNSTWSNNRSSFDERAGGLTIVEVCAICTDLGSKHRDERGEVVWNVRLPIV